MKYRYNFKGKKSVNDEKKRVADGRSSARYRVLIMLLWATVAVGAYLFISKYSMIYTTYIFGGLLIVGLLTYFVNGILVKKELSSDKPDEKKLAKHAAVEKYSMVFVIPLIFILIYDFVSSTFKMM